ncbi:MAG: NAD(P) transhydrogenase subunit alpha [Defluviitaleaceae bacterium]|nr:NAD(P) transhydrogenase subunit alpha [Defluviitaleaceae bacterium]
MILLLIFIFVLASFLGTELISKVPSQLHTPLMAATNAISGISLVAAITMCARSATGTLAMVLSFVAIVLAAINVVGGYCVTGRMLEMFRDKGGTK